MKKGFALATLVILLSIYAGTLRADILYLSNEGKVEGVVKDKGDCYEVQTTSGTSLIPKKEVLMIERKECIIETYAKAAATVKDDDAQGHYDLAMLCKEGKWASKMREELLKTIETNPDHELARTELGFVKWDGKWMTRDEMMQARGYVRFERQWVSQDYIHQVGEWRKTVQVVKDREKKLNKILGRLANGGAKTRAAALPEFVAAAKEAGIANAEEVGNQIKDYYDECWRLIAEVETRRVTTEARVANARIVQIRNLDVAAGTEPFPVQLQLPVLDLTSVKTTVIIPANVCIRLPYPRRPEFREE